MPKSFKPTDAELAAIHSWIDAEFDKGNYGWPGFFFERNTAIEFRKQFLSTLSLVQLVGIFLHDSCCAVASAQVQSSTSSAFPTLLTLLHKQIPEPDEGKEIGFDLLGLLETGDYEPFSYHVLEEEYKAKFSVELNSYGLFSSETDYQRVAAHTDIVAGEPVVWLPFKAKLFDSHLL
ncbi:hypothetical protein [Hymenobacter sp. 102]|uniref:hypothetical protein n=1 Tax=Hymenobacter sp. 102 TaxID=3403152 RepID=UPI003CF7E77F